MNEVNYKVSMRNEVKLREESAIAEDKYSEKLKNIEYSPIAQLVERSAVNR